MFKIKRANEVTAKKERVFIGTPDYTVPDLVFTTEFSRDIILSMNSSVLKTALLNSKELLESYLKIKIVEVTDKPVKKTMKKPISKVNEEGVKKLEWK